MAGFHFFFVFSYQIAFAQLSSVEALFIPNLLSQINRQYQNTVQHLFPFWLCFCLLTVQVNMVILIEVVEAVIGQYHAFGILSLL